MLDNVFWGNTLENWGISLLIVLGTVVIAKLISLFNQKVLRKFINKTKTNLDNIILGAIESPIKFGILLIGIWIAIHRLVYPDGFVRAVDAAYRILIVLNITWLVVRLVNAFIDSYWISKSNNSNTQRHISRMMPVIKRTILVIVWIIGGIMALNNVGVNITALLGTLGIGGIAFALAAQDTIKNIFGAFTIFTDRPFSIGDTIRIDNFEGTIVDVGMRSTKMRDYDKRLIVFPNYKIADANIINITSEPMRRVVMNIGLTYDTSPEDMNKALKILRDMSSKVQYVSPKDLIANFSDYKDSALVITFIYFIENKGDIGKVISDVNLEILHSFDAAGLKFAFPSQTLYVYKEDHENDSGSEDNMKSVDK